MFRVYSIGHSVYPYEFFLSQLRKNEVDCVVDVRSTPFSKYASQYNKEKIHEYLKRHGLRYCSLVSMFLPKFKKSTSFDIISPINLCSSLKISLQILLITVSI